MKKRIIKILSFVLFALGIFFLINSKVNLTAAVIDISLPIKLDYVLGVLFLLVSIILFTKTKESGLEKEVEESGEEYYKKRVNEITRYIGDVWISQWEYEGLVNELVKRGYTIEHGKGRAAIHSRNLGKNPLKHISIQKGNIRKHLFITPDPYDPRLYQVGFEEKNGKLERVSSQVYHPKHLRKGYYNEEIEINY